MSRELQYSPDTQSVGSTRRKSAATPASLREFRAGAAPSSRERVLPNRPKRQLATPAINASLHLELPPSARITPAAPGSLRRLARGRSSSTTDSAHSPEVRKQTTATASKEAGALLHQLGSALVSSAVCCIASRSSCKHVLLAKHCSNVYHSILCYTYVSCMLLTS
jgi:hypothetical protein